MKWLLWISSKIDGVSVATAQIVRWGLLANALMIAGNALSRKLFAITWANAFDMQWHFFSAVVLLMAAYTFHRDEHVRIDIFAHRLGEGGLAWLDLLGIGFVLIPVCAAMVWVSWPEFFTALQYGQTRATRESTSDLPAWIIKGFIPLGFLLLGLQGIAEAIRCIASLRGELRRPIHRRQLIEGGGHDI